MRKILPILIAIFALIMAQNVASARAWADGNGGIPLSKLAGNFAISAQGSLTVCFLPDFSNTESCSIADSVAVSGNLGQVGQGTRDKNGSACTDITSTLGFPGGPFPPSVTLEQSVVTGGTYDPASASGDANFTDYTGGKCTGSKFNGAGATVVDTGTAHFVFSNNGSRGDFVTTTLVNSQGSYGAFNSVGFSLQQ